MVECGAVWCIVVQYGALWFSMVQFSTVWCIVVQRGAGANTKLRLAYDLQSKCEPIIVQIESSGFLLVSYPRYHKAFHYRGI